MKSGRFKFLLLTIFALNLIVAPPAFAKLCQDNLVSPYYLLEEWANPHPEIDADGNEVQNVGPGDFISANRKTSAEAYDLYQKISAGSDNKAGDLRAIFDRPTVASLLTNEETSGYAVRLKKLLQTYQRTKLSLKELLEKSLKGVVPESSIQGRLNGEIRGNLTAIRRVLGEMELSEVQELVYGKKPLKPSPGSLLGKYISETGAKTMVRTFSTTAEENGPQGPPKLVVALSAKSFPIYQKYFGRPEFLVHTHGPQQGTLYVAHDENVYNWNGNQGDLRFPAEGSLWPHILLKSSEAERTRNYFALHLEDTQFAMRPWEKYPKYCAEGAYTNCSHWIGNLPIGDKLVSAYRYPGYVDDYAANHIQGFERKKAEDQAPRVKTLVPYEAENELEQMVYKAPGHQQLAGVIGIMRQQDRAELANPGFVLVTLTARAPTERVPFMFYAVADHRAPIARNFDRQAQPY
jgi:hypothetical protein